MNINLLKKLPVAIAALASSVAFAGMDMDSRVSQLESQMKQVRTQTENDSFGAKTATARPEVDGYGWFVGIGAVYQQARVGGTEFCYVDNDPSSAYPITGSMQDIHYDWDWGINAYLGYNLNHDGYDIRAGYTYFDSSSSASVSSGLNGAVVATKGLSSVVTGSSSGWNKTATAAKSNFSLTMNMLDVTLGRDYFVSQYLALRPNYGLLSAWIDIKQNTRYSGGSTLGVNTVHVDDKSNFWGIGPEVGLDSKWYIGNGFCFFGNAKGALVYGRYDVTHSEAFSATSTQTLKINGDTHKIAPMTQAVLGIAYDTYFENNKQHLGVRIGYNIQYYFSQNQSLTDVNDNQEEFARINGDLGIQGITIDVMWSF